MGLIKNLFWVALFILSTICFVVLFEHGPNNFTKNVGVEIHYFEQMIHADVPHKKDESDKIGTGS